MKDIDSIILELINSLGDDFKVLKYVYNKNKQFIPGITPVYYAGPYWNEKEVIAAIKSLLVGDWLSSGEQVKLFENAFALKHNQKYGLMVNSGSSANLVMISTLKKYYNWQDKDEIIVSVVGFPTTIAPIVQNNLTPIFIDIEMKSLNFDINLIESKITNRTKAIFGSPVLGNTFNIDQILQLCKKYNLKFIMDNCDSMGSQWKGKYLNEYSIASSYSQYSAHHICCLEGGVVLSDNRELIQMARSFAWWGRECFCVGSSNLLPQGSCGNRFAKWLPEYDGIVDHKYVFTNIGYNLKPLDLQGSVGLVQLDKLDEIHTKRIYNKKYIGNCFNKYLSNLVEIPEELPEAITSWFGTPVICKTKDIKGKLVKYIENKKIQTRNYFAGNILLHEGYKHLGGYKDYPKANEVLDRVFFIGASPHYTTEILSYIEQTIKNFKYE
jgi:CDP-6-deoxy-D-xylo-4-hexulose-3-dehydrase